MEKQMPKLLVLKEDFKYQVNQAKDVVLKKGVSYVISDEAIPSFQAMVSNIIESLTNVIISNRTPLLKAKKILIVRDGGIGDILFLLPYIETLKRLNPKCEVDFCTASFNIGVLSISKYINNTLESPLDYSEISKTYDRVVFVENLIENNESAETLNAFDIGSQFFEGIKKGKMSSTYKYKSPEIVGNQMHIGIALQASGPARDLPANFWMQLLQYLSSTQFRISLYVSPHQQAGAGRVKNYIGIHNRTLDIKIVSKIELKEAMDNLLIKDTPHIFIGPDSGFTNLAAYHGIPTIGIFGPILSHLRFKYYKKAIGLDPVTKCPFIKETGACFKHGSTPCNLAELRMEKYSPCLLTIKVNDVMAALHVLLEQFPPKGFSMAPALST